MALIKTYLSELYVACGTSALHRTAGTTGNAPKLLCLYKYTCIDTDIYMYIYIYSSQVRMGVLLRPCRVLMGGNEQQQKL